MEPGKPAKQEAAVKVTALSYFSSMSDVETFVQLAEGEMRRRHVRDAVAVCALTDGASWLQGFIDLHRPDAVRILDFAHAAQYVSAIGEAVRSQEKWLPKKWFEGVLHRLKHEGPERVNEAQSPIVPLFPPEPVAHGHVNVSSSTKQGFIMLD